MDGAIEVLDALGIKVTANNAAVSTFIASMYDGKYELARGGCFASQRALRPDLGPVPELGQRHLAGRMGQQLQLSPAAS